MKRETKRIAIIGATASGKSALAVEMAQIYDAVILSLDSLSIYKEIDIASAKPTIEERGGIPHFGIDEIRPDERFDVMEFIELYHKADDYASERGRHLIVTGGSSFYLKTLIDGISPIPRLSTETKERVESLLRDPAKAYETLLSCDREYAEKISPGDRYRIEKGLCIYFETSIPPGEYFESNPPVPAVSGEMEIFEIEIPRQKLRERIAIRCEEMISAGLVDEVAYLESRYGRAPNPMKAIGIREVLDFFDGRYDFSTMREKIVTNTARLAKRQSTFNKSQFSHIHARGDAESLSEAISRTLAE